MTAGLKRYYLAGSLPFITFSCYRRQPHLGTAARRDLFSGFWNKGGGAIGAISVSVRTRPRYRIGKPKCPLRYLLDTYDLAALPCTVARLRNFG